MCPPSTTTSSGSSRPGISPITLPLSASGVEMGAHFEMNFDGSPCEANRAIISASSIDTAAAGIFGCASSLSHCARVRYLHRQGALRNEHRTATAP